MFQFRRILSRSGPCTRGGSSLEGQFASLGLLHLCGLSPFMNTFCAGSSPSQRSVVRPPNGSREAPGTGTTLASVPDAQKPGISLSFLTLHTRLRCLLSGVRAALSPLPVFWSSRSPPVLLPPLSPPRLRPPPVCVWPARCVLSWGRSGCSFAPSSPPLRCGLPALPLLPLPLFLALGLPRSRVRG